MKKYIFYLALIILTACSNNKSVYWCGDHPCINNKEKEAYFKKTMIVEVRNFNKRKIDDDSEIKKILDQAKINEKKRIFTEKELLKKEKIEEKELAKQIKIDEKRRIKEEKELAKQIEIDEKKRIKEEKELAKKIKLDEKKSKKDHKNLQKTVQQNEKKSNKSKVIKMESNEFNELVRKIIKRNNSRPYPDINGIPK